MSAFTRSCALLLLIACFPRDAAAADAPADGAKAVPKRQVAARLEFNPGGGPWAGETAFQGASWHALGPGLGGGGGISMQARAGIGDRFPVQDKKGVTFFEVVLENGIDDHLVVLVTSGDIDQKVRLPRDKPMEITVAGSKYTLLYPTTRVAAAPGERPSTNKATIFVKQRP